MKTLFDDFFFILFHNSIIVSGVNCILIPKAVPKVFYFCNDKERL